MDKSKRPFRKSKGSFHRWFPQSQSGDRIDYRNMSLISRFISKEGKILSRRVARLTLKQQRLISIAIKQARILSLCHTPIRPSRPNRGGLINFENTFIRVTHWKPLFLENQSLKR